MKTEYNLKATLYDNYRWHYPLEAIQWMINNIPSANRMAAADFGAGTGILTNDIAKFFDTIYGIEPDMNMADILESKKIENLNIIRKYAHSVEELKSKSINVIFTAHTLHWFDYEKTIVEFNRIIQDAGLIVSFTNSVVDSGNISIDMSEVIKKYENEPIVTKQQAINVDKYFENFFEETFPFTQNQDFNEYINALSSASFLPDSSMSKIYPKFRKEVKEVFDKHAVNGKAFSQCECTVRIGKIRTV